MTFLGTGSAIPTPRRGTSSIALTLGSGSVMLCDCGEGTQMQMMRAGVSTSRVDAILVSHLHGDHLFGLFGLLSTISLNGRQAPLTLVASAALSPVLAAVLAAAGCGLGFPIETVELQEGRQHDLGLICGLHVVASPLTHTVPAFAFSFTEQPRVLSSHPAAPVNPPPTLRVSVVQDCSDCSAAMSALHGSDLLIHEATFGVGMEEKAAQYGHSTAQQAGAVAAAAEAKLLVLTHFSGRYREGRSTAAAIARRLQGGSAETEALHEEDDATAASGQWSVDRLVEEAAAGWRQSRASAAASSPSDSSSLARESTIPIYAAEDFLRFERRHAAFLIWNVAAEVQRTHKSAQQPSASGAATAAPASRAVVSEEKAERKSGSVSH